MKKILKTMFLPVVALVVSSCTGNTNKEEGFNLLLSGKTFNDIQSLPEAE